jgi:hypothetical protein
MKKRHYPVAVALAVFAVSCSLYLSSLITPAAARQASASVAGLSADRYLNHVTYLSRDEMKGRASGSPELEQAGDYIASQFRLWGLRQAGADGTYFQNFEVTTGTELGTRNELAIGGADLKINTDFVPIPFSNTAEFVGPAVFVGYGITAPELGYDDYSGINANGKIVVALRHEPQESDSSSRFNGNTFTTHATFINKAVNAKQHGARGIVFITDVNHGNEDVGPATRGAETENLGIPSAHARRDPFVELIAKAGKDLADIQKQIDADLRPQSFDLPAARIRIATEVNRVRKPVRNVIGAVAGSDPALANEWIVVGAHYDHLGLGDRNSLAPSQVGQIHHGADDNASGTSGVLELARIAAQNKQTLKRSVLFMTFAAEEIGLLGSSYFVNNPTLPLGNIAAMINLDMIGRLSNDRMFLGGVGTSPNFRSWAEEFNRSIGLNLDYSDSGYGGSDHMSFSSKKIPVLFFFSGLHSDYHKPSDTYDKINAPGAIKVLSLAYMMMDRAANGGERLQYTEVQRARPAGGGGGGGGYGPFFGSIPDFRDDGNGVLFADVTANSPAAKAGLKGGDLLVEFDGKPVQNLYDFTYALGGKKVGDVVAVVVKRNGQDVKVNVTLEARR